VDILEIIQRVARLHDHAARIVQALDVHMRNVSPPAEIDYVVATVRKVSATWCSWRAAGCRPLF
jgi:hypothetical protein